MSGSVRRLIISARLAMDAAECGTAYVPVTTRGEGPWIEFVRAVVELIYSYDEQILFQFSDNLLQYYGRGVR